MDKNCLMMSLLLATCLPFFGCSLTAKNNRGPEEGIKVTMHQHDSEFQSCFNHALTNEQGLKGNIILNFALNDFGRVFRISVDQDRSTLKNDELN